MDTTRVLVVDDDESIVKLLQAKLKAAGINPNVAYSADEAIKKMNRDLYWVVVADIHMPGMSGVDLVSALEEPQPSGPGRHAYLRCLRGACDRVRGSRGHRLHLQVRGSVPARRNGDRSLETGCALDRSSRRSTITGTSRRTRHMTAK